MSDVVKHNVYFDCENDDDALAAFMADLDRVRLAHFSDPGPTATEPRVDLDREGALIQVETVAALDSERTRLMPADHWSWSGTVPFSHGWHVDDVVFIGGQRSLDQTGGLRDVDDIGAQTHNVFSSMERVLEEAGGDGGDHRRHSRGVLPRAGSGLYRLPGDGLRLREPPYRDRGHRRHP